MMAWGMFEAAKDDVIMVASHRAVRIRHCCQGRTAVLRPARSRRLAGPEDRGGFAGPKGFFFLIHHHVGAAGTLTLSLS